MKKTKSNNNELFTGIRRLTKLSDNKNLKKNSKKSSKKSYKKNKLDKETVDMIKIINSESSVENNQMKFQSKQNNKNMFKDVDMSMVTDFVPVDDRGNIIVHNRIADLFGPIQQINANAPQISNNMMSEVNMDLFNNRMNTLSPHNMQQPSLDMQVQQLNNMMGIENQMPMMNMQNQMQMMNMQNQMPMMGIENQLSPVNNNIGNNLANLANIYNIPKLK